MDTEQLVKDSSVAYAKLVAEIEVRMNRLLTADEHKIGKIAFLHGGSFAMKRVVAEQATLLERIN